MEEINWLSKHSNASMALFDVAQEIRGLAKAFKITGNFSMWKNLMLIATDIEKETKNMSDAVGESISEIVKKSEENLKVTLEAALAGSRLKQ